MVRISLGYPEPGHEAGMLADHEAGDRVLSLSPVATAGQLVAAQDAAARVRAAERLRDYIVRLLWRTREDPRVDLGASPRAGLMLLRAAKAYALLQGRDHAPPNRHPLRRERFHRQRGHEQVLVERLSEKCSGMDVAGSGSRCTCVYRLECIAQNVA